jgi:sugar O-acyltransferase (sialic acid O-acetyltransferase NeuD family)
MYNIIIVGAGGFAREIYYWADDTFSKENYKIKGFLSYNQKDLEEFNVKSDIIGNDDNYKIEKNDLFIIAIGDIDIKKRAVNRLKKRGAKFLSLIHPTALIVPTAKIGEGVIICPYCLISDNVQLDDFVMMNFYSSCGHNAKIGKYSILSPYSTVNGFVILENEVFLGTHSTVISGKKVGYRTKISANSVVMRNISKNKIVFGVPGRIM